VAELAKRGLSVSYRTVWNFVHEQSSEKNVLAAERDRPVYRMT
jgi:hypothetical protein